MADFQIKRCDHTGDVTFSGRLSAADIRDLRLHDFDRVQLSDTAQCPADWLLDLELIYRRLAEQQASTKEQPNDN